MHVVHRLHAQVQGLGNVGRTAPGHQSPQHLELPRREAVRRGIGRRLDQGRGHVAGDVRHLGREVAELAVVPTTDVNFTAILPAMITYAENRMYRDLDFLFTSVATTAYGLTQGSRQISVPSGTFVVPEQINVITPAGDVSMSAQRIDINVRFRHRNTEVRHFFGFGNDFCSMQ